MADDIRQWLEDLELGEYVDAFEENRIDIGILPTLTNDDLKEIGVLALGDRRRLLSAITVLTERESRSTGDEATSTSEQASAAAERRQLTVMFCDLVGSTAMSRRLDPEDLRDVMRRYQDAVSEAVKRYGGHVAKYLGDGVLVYFGWPRAYEDQAERAVRAGLAAVSAVNGVQSADEKSLQARVGIATGQVVVGDLIGESGHDAEAVTGETPNLAARLQGVAEPGQVVIGETTLRLIGRNFELDDLGEHDLKGFDGAVRAWGVASEHRSESRFEAAHLAGLAEMVGRDTELQMLVDRWDLTCESEGQVVLISGEPGIGKSHLMQAFCERIADQPQIRLRYQCSPYHVNSALYPVIQQLGGAAGFDPDDDHDSRLDKLESLIGANADTDVLVAQLFADLMSLSFEQRYGPLELSPQQRRDRTRRLLGDRLIAMASERPVVFLLEDAHWIDPTTQDFLKDTISRITNSAVLMIVTHRSMWPASNIANDISTLLTLNRLGRKQGAAVVRRLAGERASDEFIARVVERTDCVPLFLEELTKSLLDSGDLEVEAADVPETLRASLMARLDRLEPGAKFIAQIGSIVGRDFDHDFLPILVNGQDIDIHDAAGNLVQSGLVTRTDSPSGTTYTFKHALVQDTAYDSILQSTRRELHARLAEALPALRPSLEETQPELFAHHYTRGRQDEKAIAWWRKAGEIAARRSQNVEAINNYRAAVEVIATLEDPGLARPLELEFQVKIGALLMMTEGVASAECENTFLRADELIDDENDFSTVFPIKWHLWFIYEQRADLERSSDTAVDMIAMGKRTKNDAFMVEARHAAWASAATRGRVKECLDHCRDGIRLFKDPEHNNLMYDIGGHDPLVCGEMHFSWISDLMGHADRARKHWQHVSDRNEQINHLQTYMLSLLVRCWPSFMLGRQDDIDQYIDEGRRLCENLGAKPYLGIFTTLEGWRTSFKNNDPSILDKIEAGIKAFTDTGAHLREPLYLSCLADAAHKVGKFDYGRQVVGKMLTMISDTRQQLYEPNALIIQAKLQTDSGEDAALVEHTFRKAASTAHNMEMRGIELNAVCQLTRFLIDQGRRDDALEVLQPLYAWFTEGFDAPHLIEAKQLLDEVS